MDLNHNQNIEIKLLLEAIFLKYGYDFRNYSKAHIRRRILHRFSKSKFNTISEMTHRIIVDPDFFNELIQDLSINVTEMFRDPDFFIAIRNKVIPRLDTYPHIKLWHAGCATGEEAYSMAIILKEESLQKKSQIYATDFSTSILEKAKAGIVAKDLIKQYTANYQKAGGMESFSEYYTAKYEYAKIKDALKENIIFAEHNLVTDTVFSEMNMIICRNVLIYFDRVLQDKVIKLFFESLCPGGFLCLGSKETLQFSALSNKFTVLDKKQKIYMKKY